MAESFAHSPRDLFITGVTVAKTCDSEGQFQEKELDRGAYGVVLELSWQGTSCAGKRIHPIIAIKPSDKSVQDFQRECTTWSKLRHPYVAQFLGLYSESTSAYPIIVMEKVDTSLSALLEKRSRVNFPLGLKVRLLHHVALGLVYLHGRRPMVIHRDLHPKNILIDLASMTAKLADFGVAKILNSSQQLTVNPGHPHFMPPEVAQKQRALPESGNHDRIDVFSFGGVVIMTMTHDWPTPTSATVAQDGKVYGRTEYERRKELVEAFTDEQQCFLPLVKMCLENEPSKRPTSADLADEITKMKETRLQLRKPSAFHQYDLQKNLEDAQQELKESQEKLAEATSEVQQLTDCMLQKEKESEATTRQLQSELIEAQLNAKKLSNELHAATEHIRTLRAEQEKLEKELQAKSEELKGAQVQLRDLHSELTFLSEENKHLKESLNFKQSELEAALQELEATNFKVQQLTDCQSQKEKLIEALRAKEEDYKAGAQRLQRKLSKSQSTAQRLSKELSTVQSLQVDQQPSKSFKSDKNDIDSWSLVKAESISGRSVTDLKRSSAYTVGIDIGSTSTKVAISTEKPWSIDLCDYWPLPDGKKQVPTAVLYRSQEEKAWRCFAFGQEAIDKEGGLLFMNFLAHLCKQNFAEDTELTSVGEEVSLPALRIYGDILKHIVRLVKKHLKKADKDLVVEKDIKWVLTVPDMQRDPASLFMRQAVKEIGLHAHQLVLVSTAEAVFTHISWLQNAVGSVPQSLNYIAIAAGAETTDVFIINDKVDIQPKSACGASVINRAFQQFLSSVNIPSYRDFFKEAMKNKDTLKKLLQNFEASKANFDGVAEMYVEMPSGMFLLYQQQQSDILSNALTQATSPKAYMDNNFLCVSPDICLEWYEPTISSTVELVRELHTKHHVEALFVVGGFAKCKILYQRLEKEFPALQLWKPQDPGLVVVEGALRYCM